MTASSRRRLSLGASTVEEVISATQGTGLFSRLMQLAVGLAIGTDGIEITLLSYLIPCVAADWGLSTLEQGSLTASVFAGELVGAMFIGVFSDKYGRRLGFLVATVLVVVFGLLTVAAPSFWWLLLSRSMVGVGAGGMEVPFDLLSEIVPIKHKRRILMGVQVTWAGGSLFVGLMAWAVLSFGYSWRWLALFSAVPPLTVLLCFTFIPESPCWLMANGREKEAGVVLRKIAKTNGIELAELSLVHEEESLGEKSGIGALWSRPAIRKRCITACVVWGSFGFMYYGVILLSAKVLGTASTCSFDYGILSFASSSELVASAITGLYMHLLDRRIVMTLNFLLSAFTSLALALSISTGWLLITSFTTRGTAYVAANFAWLLTPELFPTEVRSTGHAICNSVARFGAIGASYWVDSSVPNRGIATLLMAVGIIGGVAGQMLPGNPRTEGNRGNGSRRFSAESTPLLSGLREDRSKASHAGTEVNPFEDGDRP